MFVVKQISILSRIRNIDKAVIQFMLNIHYRWGTKITAATKLQQNFTFKLMKRNN